MRLVHIVATSKNSVIGQSGDLPWRIKEDLQRFKRLTMGHSIVMGRKTFESIGRALPGRHSVVVSRNPHFSAEGATVVASVEKALEHCRLVSDIWGEEVFVIGGGELYRQTLELADRIELTLIEKEISGDTFYPELDLNKYCIEEGGGLNGDWPCKFLTLRRKSQ